MRVGVDATPLLGPRTGVGRYVAGLLAGLAELGRSGHLADPLEVALAGFTWRGRSLPDGASLAGRPVPARALHAAWSHTRVPPLEWLGISCEVFHATNYVLPPSRRAAGVLSIHDLSYELHAGTVDARVARYRTLVPRALARSAVVLTLTEALAEEVAAFYRLPREQVRAARPGVDPRWLATPEPDAAWRRTHHLPPDYLLFVGSAEPRKNLPVLLDALRRLGPAALPLVLAGPAGWGPPLDLTGLPAGAVHRLGYVDDTTLRSVVAGARALVYPSRHEGFGLPPLEALACGTPVVSSDLPALREVTGQHASYVPVGDVDALAAALVSPGDEPRAPARAARRAHAASWTWRRCATEALAAYAAAGARGPV